MLKYSKITVWKIFLVSNLFSFSFWSSWSHGFWKMWVVLICCISTNRPSCAWWVDDHHQDSWWTKVTIFSVSVSRSAKLACLFFTPSLHFSPGLSNHQKFGMDWNNTYFVCRENCHFSHSRALMMIISSSGTTRPIRWNAVN